MAESNVSSMHSLRRTSPKGQDFVGSCVLCGKENLSFSDMNESCDNPVGVTYDEALLEAVNEQS